MSGHQGGYRSTGWCTDGGTCGARRPPQPTVMVSSSEDCLTRDGPAELLAERANPEDGVVVVTGTQSPATKATRILDAVEGLSPASFSVVTLPEGGSGGGDVSDVESGSNTGDAGSNADSRTDGDTEKAADSGTDGDAGAGIDVCGETVAVQGVGADRDPSSLTEAIESGFDEVDADRVHLLVDPLSTSGTDNNETVYDRTHEVAMAVGRKPGLALFAVDADGFTTEFLDRLKHLFDVHLRLRTSGGRRQARWTGLTGTSDGWRPWSEIELRMTMPA